MICGHRRGLFWCWLLMGALVGQTTAGVVEKTIPRKILALYDSTYEREAGESKIHRLAEMPLNHLGLVVEYLDVNGPLPSLQEMQDVRGILTWFQSDTMTHPSRFLNWAEAAVDAGKRFVILGELSVSRDPQNRLTPVPEINRFLAKLGLRTEGDWNHITYDSRIVYKDPRLVEFERPLSGVFPPYLMMKTIDKRAQSLLIIRRGKDSSADSHLVVISPQGGYVASGYTFYSGSQFTKLQWYLQPFEFFRRAFATDEVPKPDTTTLCGRRIFYSHIDGDGWRNVSEIPRYKKQRALSAEVILKEVLERFPDLPVTIAPVVADIDSTWCGNQESLDLAKTILALPHVEAGSHSYSHPLNWAFFAVEADSRMGNRQLKDGDSTHGHAFEWFRSLGLMNLFAFSRTVRFNADGIDARLSPAQGHSRQRSYDLRPTSLEQEIQGSIGFINHLLPSGKKVNVFQWSGDTAPFEEAVSATRKAGVRNINGGDTRFDREYPSYAWVAPLGQQVGHEHQVYASNSNENTYTDLWKDRYFGFKHLVRTIRNTESPWRINPFNVYYHMYSGERLSSLVAVLENLAYARAQELIPIPTSQYAGIVDGFYSVSLRRLEDQVWRIENRGVLQTIRFDQATSLAVDFCKSKGVTGQRHFQGSLYVSLDPAVLSPVVALRKSFPADAEPAEARTYLIQSHWPITKLQISGLQFCFTAQGFGPLQMTWQVPSAGRYGVAVDSSAGHSETTTLVAANRILRLEFGPSTVGTLEVTVRRLKGRL